MAPEDMQEPDRPSEPEDVELRNGNEPDEPVEAEVGEDDPELLEASMRPFQADDVAEGDADTAETAARLIDTDDTSDADAVAVDDDAAAAAPSEPAWDRELSAHKITVELKRIETNVRQLLEGRDPKRKRKLAGTRRWAELEDDIISWRYGGRFDEETLHRLHELVVRRHFLFNRLRFLASTRPTWNT